VGAVLAGLATVLAKLKVVILLVAKLKFVASAGTALVSIGTYSLLFGWPFAAGFVARAPARRHAAHPSRHERLMAHQ
jgi:hypothetical protein